MQIILIFLKISLTWLLPEPTEIFNNDIVYLEYLKFFFLSSCSLGCYKTHKTTPCSPVKLESEKEEKLIKEYNFPTEDTVPILKLSQLKESEEIRNCLKNHHVKNIIKTVLNSDDPTEAIALAMKEPIFVELADACLKVVETPDK